MTKEKILETFIYDREQGHLIWRERDHVRKGIAGGTNDLGEWLVHVDGKDRRLHRLIWTIERGTPPTFISFIDGDKSNCRIENLKAGKK